MTSKKTCQRCKGSGMLQADLLNHGTKEYVTHIIGCPDCQGKGWREDETGRVYAGVELRNERPYGEQSLDDVVKPQVSDRWPVS